MKRKEFKDRHIGLNEEDVKIMLKKIGFKSIQDLIEKTIPKKIINKKKIRS